MQDERDPAKRKVRPVETAQSLLDFDLDESSDDSDFRIEDHAEESDDYSINTEDGAGGKSPSTDEISQSELDEDYPLKKGKKSGEESINDLLQQAKRLADKLPVNLMQTMICAGCLGSRSDDANEIVECDGCGITVHEGCYGVSDTTSESSTVSSASTEPWFCEACKAGVASPTCELCPNLGGCFKETEVGAWVHLVCALYVPGVAFAEVDKLSGVTLFEMAYSRWGSRACCLCPDARFARTGVCIACDAGMCKTYFHVTCGQREGWLAEVHTEEQDHADPFYAHCKLHSDKTLVAKRKRNCLALMLRTQKRKIDLQNNMETTAQLRIQRKLNKFRKRYLLQSEMSSPWVPTQKMPRLLPTSASACRRFMRKAERMGVDTAALEVQDAQFAALKDVQRRWHVAPAFSVEFIGYYLERNCRVLAMRQALRQLSQQNRQLLEEEKLERKLYDEAMNESTEANNALGVLRKSVERMHTAVAVLCPSKQMPALEPPPPPPLALHTVTPAATTVTTAVTQPRSMSVPTVAALKMGVGFPLMMNPDARQGKVLSTSLEGGRPLMNKECGICGACTDQHLLATCDTCHKHYHLGCLRPPLTRLPKKSKLYGWQCSECDKTSESEPEVLEKKVPRRSRARYSKDGVLVHNDPITLSPSSHCTTTDHHNHADSPSRTIQKIEEIFTKEENNMEENVASPKPEAKKMQIIRVKSPSSDSVSPLKVTIKPVELLKETKREKKLKKKLKAQGQDYASSSAGESATNSPSKKSRKRSFTSPTLTNTPLMSITPIVADSPHESPSHDNSNISTSEPLTPLPSRLASDTTFLSPNSSFSTLLASSDSLTLSSQDTPTVTDGEIATYKSNRKRRKEKHRSRYSPDFMRSPSKSHKHKRKKKSQDIENPATDVPHPRITLKIKTIPKPAGSVDPQMFYVPTDSNDGPPPAFVHKHFSKVDEEPSLSGHTDLTSPQPEPVAGPSNTPGRVGRRSGPGSRGGSTLTSPTPLAPSLTQCDVCQQPGDANNLVRCDECNRRYHFTCLEPPLNKNPKKRGYSWHCADCDPTEPESN